MEKQTKTMYAKVKDGTLSVLTVGVGCTINKAQWIVVEDAITFMLDKKFTSLWKDETGTYYSVTKF